MRSLSLIFFLFGAISFAQKTTIKDVDATSLRVLQIDVDNISRLTVIASDTDRFTASMNTEGEFATELVLNLIEMDGTWNVNLGFVPGFTPADDKLGAHKVIAAELTLEIPAGKYLNISGRCLRVKLDGTFEVVEVKLDAGNIAAKNFLASGILSTADGDINVKGLDGLFGDAQGAPNKINNGLPESGSYKILAISPKGNINMKAKN